MAEFKVPELGENVTSGDVARVLVKVGDTIARDQPVVELETDKATIEVPSSVAGVVKDIRVKQGDKVKVGAVILTVEDGASAGGAAKAAEPAAAAETPSQPERPAAREPSEPPRERAPESAPAAAGQARDAAPAPREAAPETRKQQEQKVVQMARPARQFQEAAAPVAAAAPRRAGGHAAPASPGVRRLAREVGVDIDEVQGTGPAGRISQEDVKEHARRILSSIGTARGTGLPGAMPLPDFEKWGAVERQPMSSIRRTTAERLAHAWNTVPHVTQCDKADITTMEELRRRYRAGVEKAGGNLTVTAMLVKVIATAVKQFPQFNAAIDPQAQEIVYRKYVHVGVAVDTDRGLLVPVVRDADRKNITQIAIEVQQLAEKARARKLTIDEMSGGGISISNLGGIGGTHFTPIVNWPEVAILGVSRAIVEPVWRDDKFEPRQLLPLSLSYDHRVIDGADAMRFLRWVVEAIEQPFLLSLQG